MKKQIKNKKGFAVLEAVAFLMCFIVLTVYVVDFFSAIHSGILGSITARAYLFETLQHRSNLDWMRQGDVPDVPGVTGDRSRKLLADHSRFHVSIQENAPNNSRMWVTGRKLTGVSEDNQVRPTVNIPRGGKASTILLKTGYGICIDAQCPEGG